MPLNLSEVDLKDFYQLIGLDDQVLYGYIDMDLYDADLLLIPLPDKKHWIEPISLEDDKRTVYCHIWQYSPEEKSVERVTVCKDCGTLVSAMCTIKEELCPDCSDFKEVDDDTKR